MEVQGGTGNARSTALSIKGTDAVHHATGGHGRGGAKNLLQAAFTLFSRGVTFLEAGEFAPLFLVAVPVLRLLVLPIALLK